MASRTLTVNIAGDARSFSRTVRDVERDNQKLGKSFKDVDADMARFGKGMRGLLEQTAKIGSIGLAAQGISAVGAAAAGAAAGLAPLSGALAAYPALLTTAGQAMGVWKLATLGVTDAVGGLNEKLDKSSDKFKELTPAARDFVVQLDKMKKPVLDLQRTAQEGLFPGLESGLKSISGLLPVVRPIIRDTAVAMGELAAQTGKMFGSKAWRDDIRRVGDNNVTVIERLGNAGLSMANVLRDITVEAQPLVGWLTKTGEGFATAAEKMSGAARESGGMNRFFQETRIAVDRVFRIVSDLGSVLVNVGRIAYQTIGKELIGDLTRAADEFRKWSESAKGENAIRRFFLDAEPAIREAARLTKDVVVAFAELGRGDQVAPLLRTVRTELLPAITSMFDKTSKDFMPAFLNFATESVKLFTTIGGSSGPLVAIVELFGTITRNINKLIDTFPGLGTALSAAIAAGGIYRALRIGAAITGLKQIGGLIKGGAIGDALTGRAGGGRAGGALSKAAPVPVFVTNPGVGGGVVAGPAGRGGAAGRVGGAAGGAVAGTVARGVAGRLAAGAAGIATGPVGVIGVTLAAMFGPDVIRKITSGSKTVEDALDKITKKARNVSGGSGPAFIQSLRETAAQARRTGSGLDRDLADRIDKVADQFKRSGRSFSGTAKQVREDLGFNWRLMSRRTDSTFKDIKDTVRTNMRLIRGQLGTQSEEGRKAVAANFRKARNAVRENMRDGVTSTRQGMKQIRELMARELSATYGISIRTARQAATRERVEAATGGDSPAGGSGFSNQRGGRLRRAAGGWIGARGLISGDVVPVGGNAVAAFGEYHAKGPGGSAAIINRHQAPIIERALGGPLDALPRGNSLPFIEQALGGPSGLDRLFASVRRPHMMARGGIVPVPGFPGESANASVVGRIVAIAKRFGLTLTDAFGSGHESPGHTKTGTAADFSGPDRNMDRAVKYLTGQGYLVGYDGRFGSQNWPGHGPSTKTSNFHLHVELGGKGGNIPAAASHRPIVAPQVRGGGIMGRVAQGALGFATRGANRLLDAAATAAAAVPDAGGQGGGGKRARANQAIARRMLGRFGFGPDQFAPLVRLWTGESNWDHTAENKSSGAYGIPQSLPGSKMASAGGDWRTNPATQIKWGLGYIKGRYGTPAGALSFWNSQSPHWYQGGGRVYPLSRRGKIIGRPHGGTHNLGNWQSDNALDISAPIGTGVIAMDAGRVAKLSGSYQGGAGRFDGYQVTIQTDKGQLFYTHLSRASVKAGQEVKAGQRIGASGAANNVPHLHIGFQKGDPLAVVGRVKVASGSRGGGGPGARFSYGGAGGFTVARESGQVARGTAPGSAVSADPGIATPGSRATGYEIDVSRAQRTQTVGRATNNLATLIKGLVSERRLKWRKVKRIRKLLKGRLKPANRKKWIAEETQLLGEIQDLDATIKEYRADVAGGATTVTRAEELTAGVDVEGQQAASDAAQAAADAEAERISNLPTQDDYLNAALAEAGLTPGTEDDRAVLGQILALRTEQLAAARASGDPRRVSEAIAAWQAATEALNGVDDSAQRLTEAMTGLKDEMKRQNDIYESRRRRLEPGGGQGDGGHRQRPDRRCRTAGPPSDRRDRRDRPDPVRGA